MANCKDCTQTSPQIPVYTKAIPFSNANCGGACSGQNDIFVPPSAIGGGAGGGLPIDIIAGPGIRVTNMSVPLVMNKFKVSYVPSVQLTVILAMIAKAAGVVKSNPVLRGTVIDLVELTWAYNHPIASQELSASDAALLSFAPAPIAVAYNYDTGIAIRANTKFTIAGDDALSATPESKASDSEDIIYGNFILTGVGARQDKGSSAVGMKAFLEAIVAAGGAGAVKATTQVKNITTAGANLEHYYFAYPKAWGFSQFIQNNNPGGFKRLAVSGINMVNADLNALIVGESDLMINNGLIDEAYLVYQSSGDNLGAQSIQVKKA
jgi:hypothetical protein